MKRKDVKEEVLLPLNLQFFAEGGEGTKDTKEDLKLNKDEDPDEDEDLLDEDEKKFSQKEVTNLTTREKKQGRRSVLKDLGFKSEQEAKAELLALRELKKSLEEKPDKTKTTEITTTIAVEDEEKKAAIKKAEDAENKLSAIYAGVNKDLVDDVIAIARTKTTEDKDFDDVLEDMQKDKKYASFFKAAEGSGTGSEVGGKGAKVKKENIGERLGKKNAKEEKKSAFFN